MKNAIGSANKPSISVTAPATIIERKAIVE
jgi:hypothetical protein